MNILTHNKSNQNYCFKLTSSLTKINLPYAIKNSSHLKIVFMKYIIATAAQALMLIKISYFNEHVYYNGTDIVKYAKAIALPPTASTPLIYESPTSMLEYDVFVESRVGDSVGINSLTIEILIDNAFSSDISSSNPLYLEVLIY